MTQALFRRYTGFTATGARGGDVVTSNAEVYQPCYCLVVLCGGDCGGMTARSRAHWSCTTPPLPSQPTSHTSASINHTRNPAPPHPPRDANHRLCRHPRLPSLRRHRSAVPVPYLQYGTRNTLVKQIHHLLRPIYNGCAPIPFSSPFLDGHTSE